MLAIYFVSDAFKWLSLALSGNPSCQTSYGSHVLRIMEWYTLNNGNSFGKICWLV